MVLTPDPRCMWVSQHSHLTPSVYESPQHSHLTLHAGLHSSTSCSTTGGLQVAAELTLPDVNTDTQDRGSATISTANAPPSGRPTISISGYKSEVPVTPSEVPHFPEQLAELREALVLKFAG